MMGVHAAGLAMLGLAASVAASAQVQPKRLATYGVHAIDAQRAKAGPLLRAFIVDGYGRDLALIVASRLAGEEPRIEVRFPRAPVSPLAADRLEAVLPVAVWDQLVADGRMADRALAPRQSTGDDNLSICLHGWAAEIEIADGEGGVRRGSQGGCSEGLALAFAFRLAAAAAGAMPACALIDPATTRNAATRLEDCRLLSGDRAAAAQALNVLRSDWFLNPRGPDFARALAPLFHEQARINWPGEAAVEGYERAAQKWAAHGEDGRFWPLAVVGETADRVRIEGVIQMTPGEHEQEPREARAVMLWTRENGFDFRLRSLVSDAAPPPPPDDH